jgi:hypothetical protein
MEPNREGIIRYDTSDFSFSAPLPAGEYAALERYRRLLHRSGLIGAYPDGLGYGNISARRDYSRLRATAQPQFLITGTQTGHLEKLGGGHYVRVLDFDRERFAVSAQGSLRASSETVTHAAIYAADPAIRAVIHVHSRPLWQGLIEGGYPATSRWIPYGTREMAVAVETCLAGGSQGVIVMKGHPEGAIAYGPSLSAALGRLERVCRRFVAPAFHF